MPDFDSWLAADPTAIETAYRAHLAWTRIQDKPTSVVFRRNGTDLAAQTVRIEVSGGSAASTQALGVLEVAAIVIYGIEGHATQDDTNLKRGDRFVYDNREYSITAVLRVPGEVQGIGERVG